jgi:hypothetical protein
MTNQEVSRAGASVMQMVSGITTAGVNALLRCNENSREAAVSVATQAVIGAANILAALIGKAENNGPPAINNDTILLALLVATHSADVKSSPVSEGEHAGQLCTEVAFDQSPASYLSAVTTFERITGRSAAGVATEGFMRFASLGGDEAAKLLTQVCANHKPA